MEAKKARSRGGFTLVELLMCLMIVSLLSVAGMRAVDISMSNRIESMKSADARVLLSTAAQVITQELRFGTIHGDPATDRVVLESDTYGKGRLIDETTRKRSGINIYTSNGTMKADTFKVVMNGTEQTEQPVTVEMLSPALYRVSGNSSALTDYNGVYTRLYLDMSFGSGSGDTVSVTLDVKDGPSGNSLCNQTLYVKPLNPKR